MNAIVLMERTQQTGDCRTRQRIPSVVVYSDNLMIPVRPVGLRPEVQNILWLDLETGICRVIVITWL